MSGGPLCFPSYHRHVEGARAEVVAQQHLTVPGASLRQRPRLEETGQLSGYLHVRGHVALAQSPPSGHPSRPFSI